MQTKSIENGNKAPFLPGFGLVVFCRSVTSTGAVSENSENVKHANAFQKVVRERLGTSRGHSEYCGAKRRWWTRWR